MNQHQLRLTQLLGSKELKFWCVLFGKTFANQSERNLVFLYDTVSQMCQHKVMDLDTSYTNKQLVDNTGWNPFEIIWHPAHLHDFHNWLVDSDISWRQTTAWIWFENFRTSIPYDSSKDLLDQSEETLAQIIELITNNS